MRKRICAMILALVLAASILPASVLAAEENLWDQAIVQSDIDSGDGLNLEMADSGTYRAGAGTAVWERSTYTVTLNNAAITAGDTSAIRLPAAACTLVLKGTNTIASNARGLQLPNGASLTVEGPGSLDINLNSQDNLCKTTNPS